ncbi:hypothetical protein GCM10011611_22170 [Aliidongia dinghuensis]|uniref:DUF3035 domain-containing protein n=1 Tax=Aliidongia dinghuensis TaxID=1867774 RepID=A0A8J2YTC1_9PROT|nr:DUF3035 domain-containing protein [Aliidongia dinghuensis]GGF15972.1 hypothetical protein GCM10011611_22170 [Aliidongia dinghuensis]
MKRTAYLGTTLALLVIGLSGCSDTRKALGIDKAPPDEFAVVAGSPLTMPPDFNLRPPRSPSDKPPSETAAQAGRQTVFRLADTKPSTASLAVAATTGANGVPLSAGEQALVAKAGAGSVDPSIRQQVDKETAQLNADNGPGFVDSLLFWRDPTPPGEAVDAQRESQRLRENAALGKPASVGDTPQIERKQRAWLEGLF